MRNLVTTTPHPEDKPKTYEEKKAMTRKQTPEERTKFLGKNKFYKVDHDESVANAQDLAARDE